jgi:AraC-like DNA-binding protein
VIELASVDGLPPRHRVTAWQELVSRTLVPVEVTADTHALFRGRIESTELGPLRLSEVTSEVQRVRRTPRVISPSDPQCYLIAVALRESAVLQQDGRRAALAPGDLTICDTTRPYEFTSRAPFRLLVIRCPRRLLRLAPRDVERLTATSVSGQRGVGALVSPFLSGLLPRLADNVIDLLRTTFEQHLRDAELVPDSRQRLMTQVLRFVEDNLHDPGLSPAGIAAALHISTRYVHKLFAAEGTTACVWIRARRLEGCRRDLGDPALSTRSVSAVGARWGLPDPSRFSRLFREAYQLSPSEYRLRYGGGPPVGHGGGPPVGHGGGPPVGHGGGPSDRRRGERAAAAAGA